MPISFVYSHAFIYGDKSTINFVAWSLEIEVQFYLLMPLIANVYRISKPAYQRLVLAAAAGFIVLQLTAIDRSRRTSATVCT